MNKYFKMSMLAALTMSSASIFAAAGDPVTGGSGNVDINGTVQNNTCAVAVDKTALTVKIMTADFNNFTGGARDLTMSGDTTSTFTLSNCNGQPIKVLITPTAGNAIADQVPYWSIPGLDQLSLKLSTPRGTLVGGKFVSLNTGNDWTANVDYTSAGTSTTGIKLSPSADTTTFPVAATFGKRGTGAYSGPSTFTIGYTYNLTYL